MGAEPYWYYTKYQTDLNAALQGLRQQEFNAGRYNPAIRLLDFPITDESPSLGAQHLSIEDVLMASEADGTRSILDIVRVSDTPCTLSRDEFEAALLGQRDYEILGEIFNTAFPLPVSELVRLFGTEQPTHDTVQSVIFSNAPSEAADALWNSIDRGTARYIIIYERGEPTEIFFLGYSFD